MSKSNPSRASSPAARQNRGGGRSGDGKSGESAARAIRETVESIVIAIILAFLFRAFIAEAFVIPTGSMAPTLQGRHKDVQCVKCGFWYKAGASVEVNEESEQTRFEFGGQPVDNLVIASTCPICRYRMTLDLFGNPNHNSFNGDRILVSKFSYLFGDPERWDVIVFKYPGNAKVNYIKRLIGLPGETLLVRDGDVWVKPEGEAGFGIARKPDDKLWTMMHIVDDTEHIAPQLVDAGFPPRWQPWSADGAGSTAWTIHDGGQRFDFAETGDSDSWLRYHHILPTREDWEAIERGNPPADLSDRTAQLITDFYAYNAYTSVEVSHVRPSTYDPRGRPEEVSPRPFFGSPMMHPYGTLGLHWVGDQGLSADVEVEENRGAVILKLVEAGTHVDCRFDIETGNVVLTLSGETQAFSADENGQPRTRLEAISSVRGPGRYRLRMTNVDNEVRVWVGDDRLDFGGPVTYEPGSNRPHWSPEEPGDLAPAGIGIRGTPATVHRLKVYRDVYYTAVSIGRRQKSHEYDGYLETDNAPYGFERRILEILRDPAQWDDTPLWDMRRQEEFRLGENQFFPMGDNSPQSADARIWDAPAFVERKLITGKALLIYWPHAWNRPVPFWPNFRRMGLIQ